jgi:hypothetical protein
MRSRSTASMAFTDAFAEPAVPEPLLARLLEPLS